MDTVEFEARLDRWPSGKCGNIAERFRAEDALRESVERFQFRAMDEPDGFYDEPFRPATGFMPTAFWFWAV